MSIDHSNAEPSVSAYLTSYDGVLCPECALGTDDFVGDIHLVSLIPLDDDEVGEIGLPCEECRRPLGGLR